MPHRLCPLCGDLGRLLESVSEGAVVQYYRCDPCGHVWSHSRNTLDSPPVDVTERAGERLERRARQVDD